MIQSRHSFHVSLLILGALACPAMAQSSGKPDTTNPIICDSSNALPLWRDGQALATDLIEGDILAPGRGNTHHQLACIDLNAAKDAGLTFPVTVKFVAKLEGGRSKSHASFAVYPGSDKLIAGRTIASDTVKAVPIAYSWDVRPGVTTELEMDVIEPATYWFAASGNWTSRAGSQNSYTLQVRVFERSVETDLERIYTPE